MAKLTVLMIGLPFMLLASPAAAIDTYVGPGPSFCAATATFSGNSVSIALDVDRNGNPVKGSHVVYGPAGDRNGLTIAVLYPMNPDQSVAGPASLQVGGKVNPRDAGGRFVLTIGGQDFKSSLPGFVLGGDPSYRGKVAVGQGFEMKSPLLDALAAGGPGRLVYLDKKGAALVEADLTFAPKTAIAGAVEKAYPTALKLATTKSQC